MALNPVADLTAFVPGPDDVVEPVHAYKAGWTAGPGVTNLFWTVLDTVSACTGRSEAIEMRDSEGEFDATLRLTAMPLNMAYAAGAGVTLLSDIGQMAHSSLNHLEPFSRFIAGPLLGLGFAVCAIEGIYEAICVKRNLDLRSLINYDQPVVSLQRFRARFFTVGPEEAQGAEAIARARIIKRADLDRSLWGSHIAQQIAIELPQILANGTEAQARALLQRIDTQSSIYLLIHAVGLFALALCAAAFILTMVACPVTLPFVLMTVGGALMIATFFYGKGLADEGWGFSLVKAFSFLESVLGPCCCCPTQAIEMQTRV